MRLLRLLVALMVGASTWTGIAHAADAESDPLHPVRRFIGEWAGVASGQGGEGTVVRKYAAAMNGRYVHEVNTSRYPPQEKNKAGEVHEHWSMFSYDKARKLVVLRQFHVEGFVNTYRQAAAEGAPQLVFESEAFENFNDQWKARESYEFLSDDEFIETFELAPPGKPFEVYSRNRLKRVSR